jgi:hypothetical protein
MSAAETPKPKPISKPTTAPEMLVMMRACAAWLEDASIMEGAGNVARRDLKDTAKYIAWAADFFGKDGDGGQAA